MKMGLDKLHGSVLQSDMRDLPATPLKGAIRRNTRAGCRPGSPLSR